MNLPEITITGLAKTSLLVSLVILVFLPLRPLLRRFIGSQWVALLWLILLARLLAPWPLETRLGLVQHKEEPVSYPAPVTAETVKIKISDTDPAAGKNTPEKIPHAAPVTAPAQSITAGWDWLVITWFAGVGLTLVALAWRCLQTGRLAKNTQMVIDERLLGIFASIPEKWRRNVDLKIAPGLQVPTLAGILRPQIWMPSTWPALFTDEELRSIFLHELGHARRRDLLVQWAFAIAQCIHWFNPLVWIAARAARFDREMACDAWVLARTDSGHEGYGSALLKTVQLLRAPQRLAHTTVAMASSRKSLRERITGIGTFQPVSAWRGAAGTAVMLATLALATTGHMAAQEAPAKTEETSPQISAAPESAKSDDKAASQHVHIESTFVLMTVQAWKELAAKNPAYKALAGKFPDPDHEAKFTLEEVKSDTSEIESWKSPGKLAPIAFTDDSGARKLIETLAGTKDVHVLNVGVETRPTQRAIIQTIREFRYPTAFEKEEKPAGAAVIYTPTEFKTQNLGITLEVNPSVGGNGNIELELIPEITSFLGFVDQADNTKTLVLETKKPGTYYRPAISTATGKTLLPLNSKGAQTSLFGGVAFHRQINDTPVAGQSNPGSQKLFKWAMGDADPERYVLLVFVTASIEKNAAPPPPKADASTEIKVESKFVQINEDAYKKLAVGNPFFKKMAEDLPELNAEIKPYGKLAEELVAAQGELKERATPLKLAGVLPQAQFEQLLQAIDKEKGVDLLSAPAVTMKNGQTGNIEVTREFHYPSKYEENKDLKPVTTKDSDGHDVVVLPPKFTPTDFVTKNLGVILKVKSQIGKEDNAIDLNLTPEIDEYLGYLQEKEGKEVLVYSSKKDGKLDRPVFATLSAKADVSVWSGQTVMFAGVKLEAVTPYEGAEPHMVHKVVLVFVTAKFAEPKKEVEKETAAAAPADPLPNSKFPYGKPVPGKEGFATSPYAPEKGYIDLRGFPRGTEVKDPYTGKIFLTP